MQEVYSNQADQKVIKLINLLNLIKT